MVAGADNPVARGADPSGVNDSSTAIQASLNSGAGTVYIPAGVYRIDTTLTVGSHGTVIQGEGRGDPQVSGEVGTVLKGNGLSGPILDLGSRKYVSVLDLQLQSAPEGLRLNSAGVNGRSIERIYIKNCTRGLRSFGGACWLANYQDITVENALKAFDYAGAPDNTTLQFRNCHAIGLQPGGRGFHFAGAVGAVLFACSVTDVTTTDAYAIEADSQAWSLVLNGFLFRNNRCGVLHQAGGNGICVSMNGGLIHTDACTASTPVLFDIGQGDFVATGLHVMGATNYPDIMNEAGIARFLEPKPNIRNLPGMPAGVKILYDGAWV